MRFTVLDLFSGIGGMSLGLERTGGFRTVGFVEIDPYCRRVLAKHWPEVPQFDDVRTIGADELAGLGRIDVIAGGFPCQDVSLAGARLGLKGERSTLWSEFARLIRLARPRWVLAENVPGLLSSDSGRFFGNILADLAACGMDAQWQVLPAAAFGAPHIRERVFLLAYAERTGLQECARGREQGTRRASIIPAGQSERLARQWESEPSIRRVAHGIPARVDRLRALGNAVVPQVVEWIGYQILAAEETQP